MSNILLPTENLSLREPSNTAQSLAVNTPTTKAQAYQSDDSIPFRVDIGKVVEKETLPLVEIIDKYYEDKYKTEKEILLGKAVNEFQEKDRDDLLAYTELKGQDAVDGWEDYLKQRETRKREFQEVFIKHPDMQKEWTQKIDDIQGRNKFTALDYKVKQVDALKGQNLQATLTNALNDYTLNFNSPRNALYKDEVIKAFNDIQEYAGIRQFNADGTTNEVYEKNRRDLFDETAKQQIGYMISLKQYGGALQTLNVMKNDVNASTYSEMLTKIKDKQADEYERAERIKAYNAQKSFYQAKQAYEEFTKAESAKLIEQRTQINLLRSIQEAKTKDGKKLFDTSMWKTDEHGQIDLTSVPKNFFDNLTKDQQKFLSVASNNARSIAEMEFSVEQQQRKDLGDSKATALNSVWNYIVTNGYTKKLTMEQRADPLKILEDHATLDPTAQQMLDNYLAIFGDVDQARKALNQRMTIGSNISYAESEWVINGLKNGTISDADFDLLLGSAYKVAQYEFNRGVSFSPDATKAILERQGKIRQLKDNGKFLKNNEVYSALYNQALQELGCDLKKVNEFTIANPAKAIFARYVAGLAYEDGISKTNQGVIAKASKESAGVLWGKSNAYVHNAGFIQNSVAIYKDLFHIPEKMDIQAEKIVDGISKEFKDGYDDDVKKSAVVQIAYKLWQEDPRHQLPSDEEVYQALKETDFLKIKTKTLQGAYDNQVHLKDLSDQEQSQSLYNILQQRGYNR